MKKAFTLVLILIITLSMCGCVAGDSAPAEVENDLVIGACLSQSTVTPFGVYLRQDIEQQCLENGWELILQDAERDAVKQQAQIEAILQMDIDLLLYWPVERSTGAANCQMFYEAGIPVVIMNADVAEDGIAYTTAFVGPDQYGMGYDIGSYLADTTPAGGNIVMISGGTGSTQFIQRQQGFEDAIANTGLELLQVEYSNSDRSRAYTIMENYLTIYDDIDIVYCASDNLALGAVSAIEAAGATGIRVVSIDGMSDAFQLIREGKMELTVLQTPQDIALEFSQVAQDIFDNGALPEREHFSQHTLITSENVDSYIPEY